MSKQKHKKSVWSAIGITTSFLGATSLATVSLFALRKNNQTMLELRENLINADETGVGVEQALTDLRGHITSHMNADPPKLGDNSAIQLLRSYERARQAEVDRVSAARTAIAQEATAYCEANVRNVQLSVRAECVASYTSARPVVERQIVADLYRYNFVSPRWSPDLAGWSLLLSILLFTVFILQLLARLIARLFIRN